MKYDDYNEAELIEAARNLNLEIRGSRRSIRPTCQQYREALRLADKDIPFRFLNLSAELRNEVYNKLLTEDKSSTCHPQILATCKQINDEAADLLYANNTIRILIREDIVFVRRKVCEIYSPFPDEISLIRDLVTVQWPDYLLRAHHLSVELDSRLGKGSGVEVNKALYSLCSFLQQGHSLRSFEFDKACVLHYGDASGLLYALGKLHGVAKVVVGNLDAEKFERVMRSTEAIYPGNVLHQWMLLQKRARAYESLSKTMPGLGPTWLSPGRHSYYHGNEGLHQILRNADVHLKCDTFIDAKWDKKLEDLSYLLRAFMNRFVSGIDFEYERQRLRKKADELQRLWNEFEAAIRAR